jgi:hypothetical protein
MPRRKKALQPTINNITINKDLVKPTQYHYAAASWIELPPIYKKINENPNFKPLKLDPINSPGLNLLENINLSDLELVFYLLFNNSIIDSLVYYTNTCTIHTRARPDVDNNDSDNDNIIIITIT